MFENNPTHNQEHTSSKVDNLRDAVENANKSIVELDLSPKPVQDLTANV